MKLKIKFTAIILLILGIFAFSGCSDDGGSGDVGTTMTDQEIVSADKEDLDVGISLGQDMDHVTSDIDLVTSGTNGSTITWETDNSDVITTDGTVTRPAFTDQDVTLTATVTKGSESEDKVFTLTVKAAGHATVTYHGNGGTAGTVPIDATEYEVGDTVTVLNNTGNLAGVIIRDGIRQRFIGWNTDSEVTTAEYEAGDTFSITENITLYAIYTTGTDVLRKVGPAGGWVFYDHGSTESWGRYLEAWNEDELEAWEDEGSYEWKTNDTFTLGTSTDIGTGWNNTYNRMTGAEHPAADVVREATHGDSEEWFLPSKDELDKMYINLHSGTDENSVTYTPVGGFANDYYWSSSETGAGYAWSQDFDDGSQYGSGKSYSARVRAVRAF